ncbi:uncharacterized protein [Euphorbia lathyris]
MVWYLYSITDDKDLLAEDRIGLLVAAITSNLLDIALELIQKHPELAIQRGKFHVFVKTGVPFKSFSLSLVQIFSSDPFPSSDCVEMRHIWNTNSGDREKSWSTTPMLGKRDEKSRIRCRGGHFELNKTCECVESLLQH